MTVCPASGPSSERLETFENTVLYLIGHCGSGKRTIALEIQKLLPAVVVDNHYMLNVIFALLERDAQGNFPAGAWERTREIRATVHRTIRELSPTQRNFVFTNNLWENCDESLQHFQEVQATAQARQAFFLPVRLHLSEAELARRVVCPSRVSLSKLTNAERVITEQKAHEVYRPACAYLDLEISSLNAAEAARKIVQECAKLRASGATP